MKKNIEEITKQLEEGVKGVYEGDGYKTFLDVMSKFYNYSANNCVLIAMQMPTATLVAGYRSWENKFNRHVKKGEKAIKILAPIPHKFKKMIENEDGEQVEKEVQYTTFRAVPVFDISQTEGDDLPSIVKELDGSVDGFKNLFERLESISPVPVCFEDITGGANGYFSHAKKMIAIRQGMSEQQTVKTLIHEIAHALLHDKETGAEKDADKRTKEVQAESVAYTVCSWLGLDTSDYSFGYVAGWSEGKDVKELTASMEVIRKTAKEVIEGLQGVA